MPPDPADLINTILAAVGQALLDTPTSEDTLFEWHRCDVCRRPGQPCDCSGVPYPSKPVRAGLAAAVRALADHAIDPEAPDDPRWTGGRLRELADQLDTQEGP